MPTFTATLKRSVTIVERAQVPLEADSQQEAEEAATAITLDLHADHPNLTWEEDDVSESEISEAEVEKVILHAYDQADNPVVEEG